MSVERPCDVCGEFYAAHRPNSRFCGPACRQRAARRGKDPSAESGDEPDEPGSAPGSGVLPAAQSGDRLAALIALRDTLARQIDSSRDPFGLPALAEKLMKVLEQVADLQPPERKGTALDELARRRSGGGRASGASRSARSAQRR